MWLNFVFAPMKCNHVAFGEQNKNLIQQPIAHRQQPIPLAFTPYTLHIKLLYIPLAVGVSCSPTEQLLVYVVLSCCQTYPCLYTLHPTLYTNNPWSVVSQKYLIFFATTISHPYHIGITSVSYSTKPSFLFAFLCNPPKIGTYILLNNQKSCLTRGWHDFLID